MFATASCAATNCSLVGVARIDGYKVRHRLVHQRRHHGEQCAARTRCHADRPLDCRSDGARHGPALTRPPAYFRCFWVQFQPYLTSIVPIIAG